MATHSTSSASPMVNRSPSLTSLVRPGIADEPPTHSIPGNALSWRREVGRRDGEVSTATAGASSPAGAARKNARRLGCRQSGPARGERVARQHQLSKS
jgi:hypothetical protein